MRFLTIREIKDAALFDLATFKHELVTGSIWEYKEKRYRFHNFNEKRLIQYEDIWYPTVEYSEYVGLQGSDLMFFRAVPDFLSKFKRIG